MKRIATNGLVALLLVAGFFFFPISAAESQNVEPPPLAPALRGPDDHQYAPLSAPSAATPNALSLTAQEDGLKAVAIVGDVGSITDVYRKDMGYAVDALRNRGVTVETFYYGQRTFDWSDVVSAATGANFLLYMGHGVYWGEGTCTEPELVGGFYLGGSSGFIHPDQVRSDLAGRMADNAAVIFSHSCYTAGDAACDSDVSNWPSQAEAERRVRMYAAPFVDAGVEAYFANNYYYAARDFVEQLLGDSPVTAGQAFQSVTPYDPDQFRDLTYPQEPYDLWLSGKTASWNDGFVGIPDHAFSTAATPQLGDLPDTLTFTRFTEDPDFLPSTYTFVPENVGSDDPLTWEVTGSGSWFTVSPTSGETSMSSADASTGFTIEPSHADVAAAASYSGVVTVTVTSPEHTVDAVQTIQVTLETLDGSPNRLFVPLVSHY